MRFRRDHERFIGGYDPEHEMPDPDRDPRDRWQSDAYRHNARDTRWFYRWNPDRIENREWSGRRFGGYRPYEEIHPRDRYAPRFSRPAPRGYEAPWQRGYPRPWDYDNRGDYDRGYDLGPRRYDRPYDDYDYGRPRRYRDDYDWDEWFDSRDYFRR